MSFEGTKTCLMLPSPRIPSRFSWQVTSCELQHLSGAHSLCRSRSRTLSLSLSVLRMLNGKMASTTVASVGHLLAATHDASPLGWVG